MKRPEALIRLFPLSKTLIFVALILADAAVVMDAMAEETPSAVAGSRPNIVFLCADDQAQWALGAYGNREIKTPNLDRLARRGAIFRNAFTVTPVCSPSRAALMTSRYPSELGIADWINPGNEPDLGLAPSAIIWPELLKGIGYSTSAGGQVAPRNPRPFPPDAPGVRRLLRLSRRQQPADRPPARSLRVRVRQLKGSLPDLLVDEGLKFVEAHRDGPFLLSIHFRALILP